MRRLAGFSVSKFSEEPHLNADAIRSDEHRGTHAICDGATECFAPVRWAKILARTFAGRPDVNDEWLASAIALYERPFNRSEMNWVEQGAYDRGSFSTLLGLRSEETGVSLVGIGDSLAVLVGGNAIRATFPYCDPAEFDQRPLLLSTIPSANEPVLAAIPSARWDLSTLEAPRIYCMTDRLGQWLLSDPGRRMAKLVALHSPQDFIDLVDHERESGALTRDDTTLLVLG